MDTLWLTSFSCLILGAITTMHPCPMTTNIAAISLMSGWSAKERRGSYPLILFVLGYTGAYMALSALLGAGLFIKSTLSYYLQNIISIFLGPILIFVGMILTDLIPLNRIFRNRIFSQVQHKKWSGIYALPMGALLALGFCPATAAIFFGILIPLAVQHKQVILFPAFYGVGASIPLVSIAMLIIQGKRISFIKRWQRWVPIIAGWILILAGIVLSLQRIFL